MVKDQSQIASFRQREEMVKRVLAVAELLAKGSEVTPVAPKTNCEDGGKTRVTKHVVSS